MTEDYERMTYSELRRLKQAVSVELNRRKRECAGQPVVRHDATIDELTRHVRVGSE